MEILTKTYNIVEGELKFEFHYDDSISNLTDFTVTNLSPLKYGYDSSDPKEVSIYPANISIEIDDFNEDNYNNFKKFYQAYTNVYPFNFYSTFYVDIKLNSVVIFKGILDELESDNENKLLTLTFVDGINKYKDIQIDNPTLLNYLHSVNLVPRVEHFVPFSFYVYAYGFRRIRYITQSIIGTIVKTPGYIIDQVLMGISRLIFRKLLRN